MLRVHWVWGRLLPPKCEECGGRGLPDILPHFKYYSPDWAVYFIWKWHFCWGPLTVISEAAKEEWPARIKRHNLALRGPVVGGPQHSSSLGNCPECGGLGFVGMEQQDCPTCMGGGAK